MTEIEPQSIEQMNHHKSDCNPSRYSRGIAKEIAFPILYRANPSFKRERPSTNIKTQRMSRAGQRTLQIEIIVAQQTAH